METQRSELQLPAVRNAPGSLGKTSKPTGQRSFLLPIKGGRSISHQDAAERSAERRWNGDVQRLGFEVQARILEAMTPELQDATTQAEMKRKGDGVALILENLKRDALTGQPAGPPGGGSELSASSGDRRGEVRAISN